MAIPNTWKRFESLVKERPIPTLYETPGKELIQHDKTKEILGVRAQRRDESIYVKARKGVVLTCGGFENNQQMIRNYLPGIPYCYTSGSPYNEGDGITMAMSVGADLWHMNNYAGPSMALKAPEIRTTFSMQALHFSKKMPGGMIVVGPDGTLAAVIDAVPDVHDLRPHAVLGRPALRQASEPRVHADHRALRVERRQQRRVGKGLDQNRPSIASLASAVGLDPTALEGTVGRWNRYCEAKHDPEFGRTLMMEPIVERPFYAVELSPSMLNTQGGPRRNEKGQIVRPGGTPIGRLYSAGELGSIHSYLYQGTGNIGECLAFGKVSGRNVAAEPPWEQQRGRITR